MHNKTDLKVITQYFTKVPNRLDYMLFLNSFYKSAMRLFLWATANASTTASTGSECTLSCSIAKIATLHSLLSDIEFRTHVLICLRAEKLLSQEAVGLLTGSETAILPRRHSSWNASLYNEKYIRHKCHQAIWHSTHVLVCFRCRQSLIRSSVSAMYASANGFKQCTSAKWLYCLGSVLRYLALLHTAWYHRSVLSTHSAACPWLVQIRAVWMQFCCRHLADHPQTPSRNTVIVGYVYVDQK